MNQIAGFAPDAAGKSKVLFAQFANSMLSKTSDICKDLYRACYPRMPGYEYQEDFLELPYWINIINGMLMPGVPRELLVINSINNFVESVTKEQPAVVMFSVMNVTETYVEQIVAQCPGTLFILGGYTNPTVFMPYRNTIYIKSPKDLPAVMPVPIDISRPPDYTLFNDRGKWMPRITLSMGCLHQCRFCAVPRELTKIDYNDVIAQAKAFKGLEFELVYLDDKTFGQASNYRTLHEVYEIVKGYNPGFIGFVAQTTATALARGDCSLLDEFVTALHVRYLEVGVETCDDRLLADLKKPQRMKQVHAVCVRLRALNSQRSASEQTRLIPNILFGIKGDTYERTISFIESNLDLVPTINYANISTYPGRRDETFLSDATEADRDDYDFGKSWLDADQVTSGQQALERIVALFGVERSSA